MQNVRHPVVDLRSDTVTRPTPAMRAAMAGAEVGDDVFGDDPTVNALQQRIAALTGKEAALFMPSGTQSNLCAILAHCGRGDEYIVGQLAHTYRYEAGGAAVLGSVQPQPLAQDEHGQMQLKDIAGAIKPDDIHFACTRLLCLENTWNGHRMPMAYLEQATGLARARGLACHLDGARFFNAAADQAQRAVLEIEQNKALVPKSDEPKKMNPVLLPPPLGEGRGGGWGQLANGIRSKASPHPDLPQKGEGAIHPQHLNSSHDLPRLDLSVNTEHAQAAIDVEAILAEAQRIASMFDSVSVCFSKGLGAPVGSALCGSAELIERALRIRKMAGGGMRQVGILAAGALHALEHHVLRLADDHANAERLAQGLRGIPGLTLRSVATNIVFVDVADGRGPALLDFLKAQGVLATGLIGLRFVTHLDVSAADIDHAVACIRRFFA